MPKIKVLPSGSQRELEFNGNATQVDGVITIANEDGAILGQFASGSHWYSEEEPAETEKQKFLRELSKEQLDLLGRMMNTKLTGEQVAQIRQIIGG